MTTERFKLFVGNNYGVQTMDGEVIFDSIRSIADADVLVDLLNDLSEENERLKEYNNKLMKQPLLFDVQTIPDTMEIMEANSKLEKENEQLQARNDRQAKRLAELYELMAKKDWESLTEIIDDFKRCEEQLQRESVTYW